MSLRDYFAGQAMQGILSYYGNSISGKKSDESIDFIAKVSYQHADAMIKERK